MVRVRIAWKGLSARFAAAALLIASAGPAQAGSADATSELHLKLAITASRLVNVNMMVTGLTDGMESGYGAHAEDFGGEVFAVNRIYDGVIYSSAYAFSPPTSNSLSSIGMKSAEIAVLDNFSDEPTSITIDFAADFALSASTSGPYSYAAASGAYAISGSGSAAPLAFEDRGVVRAHGGEAIFGDRSKAASFTFLLPAQGTYRLFSTGSVVATLAHASEVPEPETWVLMIGGFGLAGTALRRRLAVVSA